MPRPQAHSPRLDTPCTLLVLLIALFLFPISSSALEWASRTASFASFPTGAMDSTYHPSASVSLSVGIRTSDVDYRLVAMYSALRGAMRNGIAHTGAAIVEVSTHDLFGYDRFNAFGGGGVGIRRLREGHFERDISLSAPRDIVYQRTGVDELVYDLVWRTGVRVALFKRANWSLDLSLIHISEPTRPY